MLVGFAQELDSNGSSRSQGSISDQISDPAERAAFVALYQKTDPRRLLGEAQAFLQQFPQSAFLAQVLEIAARSSFDQGDYKGGLEYARQSLVLLPENPLLLVAVADAQAGQSQNDAAIVSARDALAYLDRFVRPISVSERDWPEVKRKQQAIAYFVLGRAALRQSLEQPSGEARRNLLADSRAALSQARLRIFWALFSSPRGIRRRPRRTSLPFTSREAHMRPGRWPHCSRCINRSRWIQKQAFKPSSSTRRKKSLHLRKRRWP